MSRKFIKFFFVENPLNETNSVVDILEKTKQENEVYVNNLLSYGREIIAKADEADIPDIVEEAYDRIMFTFPNALSCADLLSVKTLTDYDNVVARFASRNDVGVNPIHQLYCCEEFADFCLGEDKSYNTLKLDEIRQLVSTIQEALENPVKGQEMGNKWVYVNPSDILHTRNLIDSVVSVMEKMSNNGKETYLLCIEQV
jgi:hypothetical protein